MNREGAIKNERELRMRDCKPDNVIFPSNVRKQSIKRFVGFRVDRT